MADRREPHDEHDPVVIARAARPRHRGGRASRRGVADRVLSRRVRLSTPTCWRSRRPPERSRRRHASVIHAHRGRRRAPGRAGDRGTGWRDGPSRRCHDRSFHRVRPCLARHDPRRLARRSLPPGQRARRRRGARRHVQPVRRPAGRPPRTPCRDQGDAHTRAAERLHADRARRGPPPFRRLAPLRGDPRDVARRAQPAARGRADDARSGRSPRLRGPVLHDGRCRRRSAPTTIGAPAGGRGGRERRRVEVTRRGGDPAASAAAAAAASAAPAPATSAGSADQSARTRCRLGPRSRTAPTQPPDTEALHQRHGEGAVRSTGGNSGSPTAPATCWPCRTSAASRPCRSCRSRS